MECRKWNNEIHPRQYNKSVLIVLFVLNRLWHKFMICIRYAEGNIQSIDLFLVCRPLGIISYLLYPIIHPNCVCHVLVQDAWLSYLLYRAMHPHCVIMFFIKVRNQIPYLIVITYLHVTFPAMHIVQNMDCHRKQMMPTICAWTSGNVEQYEL